MYKKFFSRVMVNYTAGTVASILIIGCLLVFTPLGLPKEDYLWLAGILTVSTVMMLVSGWLVFSLQIKPIKQAFIIRPDNFSALQNVYIRTHRLPSLTVKRILGPNLLGFLLPGIGLTMWAIENGKLSFSPTHVLLVAIGVVLAYGMRALIEFYLTSFSIRPLLEEYTVWGLEQFGKAPTLGGRIMTPMKRKLRWSFFLIGASPLLLYNVAIQFRFGEWFTDDLAYWKWACYLLAIGLGFALIGSILLTKEILHPIHHLYERMAEVKEGYLRRGASELFADEFSRLISAFNHMLRGIKLQAERNNQLLESYFATLAAALDARDPYTAGHSLRVAEYAVKIGELAKLPEEQIHDLRKSALLHDIGKIGTRDAVLLKDGKLSDEEWKQMKQHPVLGESILKQIEPVDAMAAFLPGVRSHHERYDGAGYPDGLQGEEIPLFGRIIAVADAYDAMTSDRPYRKGLESERALTILEEGRGTQWDPYFAGLFVEMQRKKTGAGSA